MEEEYPQIRKLTRGDRKTLSGLIQKLAERSGNSNIVEMIPKSWSNQEEESEKEESKSLEENAELFELIKNVIAGILEWVEDDVNIWFMDLCGIEDQVEYDKLPFDIETNIIEQMYNQSCFTGFFSKASELYRRIRG